MSGVTKAARFVAGAGLIGIGVLHGGWAVGSSWPAKNRRALADAVVGAESVPGAAPTAVVAIGAVSAGVFMWSAGEGGFARLARRAVGLAFLARAAVGGAAATRVLGLPDPSPTFRRLDARFYRPLCLALGACGLLAR